MRYAIKIFYRLDKTAPEIVKLIKAAYKDKCFCESAIFRWYGDLKKDVCLPSLADQKVL